MQLQHKKLAMTEAALSTDPDAALGKLTVEDVGGSFFPLGDADAIARILIQNVEMSHPATLTPIK